MSIYHPRSTADSINEWLKTRYGTNPYGDALFRVVVAEDVYQLVGGEHTIWPENSKVEDRGSLSDDDETAEEIGWRDKHSIPLVAKQKVMPVRIEIGMKEMPKYSVEGWILERWFPAEMYGSRAIWEQVEELGPYPDKGDYEMISGPAKSQPAHSQLELVIAAFFHSKNHKTGTPQQRIRDRARQAQEFYEKQAKQMRDFWVSYLKDYSSPWWGSSLAAGRLRRKIAEKAGVTEWAGS